MNVQQPSQESAYSNGCSFRCSAQAVQNHSIVQRGKDTLLLLIGLASLVHVINRW